MIRRFPFRFAALVLLSLVIGDWAFAQQQQRQWSGRRGPPTVIDENERNGVPLWDVPPAFKSDVFTFVRIRYNTAYGRQSWHTDFPDSDLNFSFRLQQMTSLRVDPKGKILDLTDEKLFDYPFIYMLEVGSLVFTDEETAALRRYLLNGGFLMVDDFWGVPAWENFQEQLARVFPDRKPVKLDISHPIFHGVFDLKYLPQIPGIDAARRNRGTGITWERPDSKEVEYYALYDDHNRIMALVCHNTDLGDGWEREGEEEWYFHEFSEKLAYPMGINIVFYAMTH